ncbi:MAG: molybdopterin-dependent oxidoreductase [Promethearchaeota archaeon]
MNRNQKYLAGVLIISAIVVVSVAIVFPPQSPPQNVSSEFPDFFTKNEDYFITRIGSVPTIDRDTYRLDVKGLIDNPRNFTLQELQSLNLTDLPLTVECIGNPSTGKLVGTALWRGFILYDLLESLGLSESATGVRYRAADGYYASHTMDQVRDNGVLGALYMNGVEIPPLHGFPLRILNPGYYGVKQPAWVTEIEVIDTPLEDYWQDRGWDTGPPIEVDTKIFFPADFTTTNASQILSIGGCAYGGTRVSSVQYTIDGGTTWKNASIVQQIDADNVWVFWQIDISFPAAGQYLIQVRATDIHGHVQNQYDPDALDGTSQWSQLTINVI